MEKERAEQISKGLLETIETMFDGHPMFDDSPEDPTFEFGEIEQPKCLPGRIDLDEQPFALPVTVEGAKFIAIAYRIG